MTANKLLLLSAAVMAILVLSTIFVAIPAIPRVSAQQQEDKGLNWVMPNYNYQATGFSPQTQITKDNVESLELKWLFPWPQANPIKGQSGVSPGSIALPLIVNGIVYARAEDMTLYALDAKTGKTLWTYQAPLDVVNMEEALKALPISPGFSSHAHMFSYLDGRIYAPWPNCQVLGINALTGKLEYQLKTPTCANLEGNVGLLKGTQSVGPVFDSKKRVLIYGTGGREAVEGGRGVFRGYSLDTGQLLWTFYLMPPQDKGDPEWTLRVADKGWIQGIRASTLPNEILLNDWGVCPAQCGFGKGDTGIGWGQWAVDEETGIAYLATGQPSPDWNATYRPGPNVFSDSVIALKTDTGGLVWWHQVTPHDLWDVDCSWNTALATINGRKIVFKECKGALLNAFDAATGEAIWRTNYSPYVKRSAEGPKTNYEDPLDVRKLSDMQKPWVSYPGNEPNWRKTAGGSESDVAVAYGKVYSTTFHFWGLQKIESVEPTMRTGSGRVSLPAPVNWPTNSTVFAHDAATGKLVWKFDIDVVGLRGGVSVSGGLVWLTGTDGTIRALDAETGKLLWQKSHGVQSPTQPVLGADADGKMKVFMNIGAGGAIGRFGAVPGALLAYGLPDKLPEPRVITKEVTKEVIKEVPKEIVKEVVKEVPREVVKEVVKEVPKEVIKEVVKEVPKEVVRTETKTVTVETISPVSYAAIGIGVVLVVVAGVLFTRRKKV